MNGQELFARLFETALLIFRPKRADRIVDETITALQVARSLIGAVAVIWITVAYWDSADDPLKAKFEELSQAATILVFAVPVVLAAFVLAARGPHRERYLSRTPGPLLAVGTLAGVYYLTFVVCPAIGRTAVADYEIVPMLLTMLVLLPSYVVAGLFLIIGTAFAVSTVFRLADVHETLPPLVSPFLVWSLFVIQLADPPMADLPVLLRVLFLIGPPVSVTALSYAELRQLRLHHGVTLRTALNRA
ncbi:hypothetical protein [Streptomyces sp. NPDC006267]|uniref:hypothetical protein n=1 Tax=unclassified Streptomyces TaxID=2593676 RepID=UPI0033B02A83